MHIAVAAVAKNLRGVTGPFLTVGLLPREARRLVPSSTRIRVQIQFFWPFEQFTASRKPGPWDGEQLYHSTSDIGVSFRGGSKSNIISHPATSSPSSCGSVAQQPLQVSARRLLDSCTPWVSKGMYDQSIAQGESFLPLLSFLPGGLSRASRALSMSPEWLLEEQVPTGGFQTQKLRHHTYFLLSNMLEVKGRRADISFP